MDSDESLEGTERISKSADIVIFGEVLYDCFPGGQRVLGGAPFNVAWGMRGFGHAPLFISAVGQDASGEAIRAKMRAWGLGEEGIQTDVERATGSVEVTIVDDEPSYEICENRAWDCVQDAGWGAKKILYHGLLALRSERSRQTFEALVERSEAQRFFDINLRPPYDSKDLLRRWIRGVDWLKLNIDELGILLLGWEGSLDQAGSAIDELIRIYGVGNVVLTAGSQGARIQGAVGEATFAPAPKPDPFVNTVGAGDSFSAYTLHGVLTGMPIEQIVENASHFAAKVCGMQGATTTDRDFYQ